MNTLVWGEIDSGSTVGSGATQTIPQTEGIATNKLVTIVVKNYSFTEGGKYAAVVKISNSLADSTSNTATCNCSATGIDETNALENKVMVYPVPADEFIKISIDKFEYGDIYTFRMYDISGREIKNQVVLSEANTTVFLGDLSSGAYLFKIENDRGKATAGTILIK